MALLFTRRNVLQTSLALPALRAQATNSLLDTAAIPSIVVLYTEEGVRPLNHEGREWRSDQTLVTLTSEGGATKLRLRSPNHAPTKLHVRWRVRVPPGLKFLGDAWERSYGGLAFRSIEPERVMPWYVLATDGHTTHAFGVKTGPGALCYWQVDPEGISLWCDVRNGGRAVELGNRELPLADVVTHSYADRSPFLSAQHFCHLMCDQPRLPKEPVYGGNNWYYAYGHSSAEDILQDSERIASAAQGLENRPLMVIDDGWQTNSTRGPWRTGNARFPDMSQLAGDMRKIGVKPGLWIRPLFTKETVAESARLSSPNAGKEWRATQTYTLDPTDPEAASLMAGDMKTVTSWGYELIKHDFSTYDLLGRWGFDMNSEVTDPSWTFRDRTRTNAEIIRGFYQLLRKAAGETDLLGCNTIGHLGAGLFEAQRTGDDTSGREWERTRKMGVNTLAFRMPQHNAFFAIDADCVGLTKNIDWKLNRQWLDLLARSGTPLFVSIAANAFGAEQREAVRQAFARASTVQAVAEPLDWLVNNEPQSWSSSGTTFNYQWWS